MFGGDLDKAIANLQRSIDRDPTADETYVWLAIAYRKKGNTAAANKALDEALRRNPRSMFALNTKAASRAFAWEASADCGCGDPVIIAAEDSRRMEDEEIPFISGSGEGLMEEGPALHAGARRDEDIALDLMKFVAMTPATAERRRLASASRYGCGGKARRLRCASAGVVREVLERSWRKEVAGSTAQDRSLIQSVTSRSPHGIRGRPGNRGGLAFFHGYHFDGISLIVRRRIR